MPEIKARVNWPSAIASIFVSICLQLIPILIFREDFDNSRQLFWQQTIGCLLIISLGYLTFNASLYRDFRFRQLQKGSILVFIISSTFLLIPIAFILVQPLAMFLLLALLWLSISVLGMEFQSPQP